MIAVWIQEADMETNKILMGGIAAMIGLAVAGGMAQAYTPPEPQFVCPIDGLKFFTYDDLYQHFVAEHPAEPIEIIWE